MYGHTPNKVLVYFCIKNYKKGKKVRLQKGIQKITISLMLGRGNFL